MTRCCTPEGNIFKHYFLRVFDHQTEWNLIAHLYIPTIFNNTTQQYLFHQPERSHEYFIKVCISYKVVGQCSSLQQIDKEWTDKERMEMVNSALSAGEIC